MAVKPQVIGNLQTLSETRESNEKTLPLETAGAEQALGLAHTGPNAALDDWKNKRFRDK